MRKEIFTIKRIYSMKALKKMRGILVILGIIFLFPYLIASFITLDFNLLSWGILGRSIFLTLVVLMAILMLFLILCGKAWIEEKEREEREKINSKSFYDRIKEANKV